MKRGRGEPGARTKVVKTCSTRERSEGDEKGSEYNPMENKYKVWSDSKTPGLMEQSEGEWLEELGGGARTAGTRRYKDRLDPRIGSKDGPIEVENRRRSRSFVNHLT